MSAADGERIPLSELTLTGAQRAAVDRVLDSGWLSMGPETAACEEVWREASGAAHALLTASCTASLWIALAAVGVGPGDEVILPSLTFVADANVVVRLGAVPVFADITSADRPLFDPMAAAAARTPRTKAVIVVHYAGYEADVRAVRHALPGVAVIEDAAHAPGPLASGRWPGGDGDIRCYSFFSNKNLGVGEGGLVATDDAELAAAARLLRSHGMDSLTWDRHRGHASSYDVLLPGMNFRPSELTAALVGAGIARLPEENEGRRRHLDAYRAELADEGWELIFDAGEDSTGHLAVIRAGGRRDEIRQVLGERHIQTSVHYPPIHRFSWYREHHAATQPLPATDEAGDENLTLPLWGAMTDEVRRTVVAAVASVPAPA